MSNCLKVLLNVEFPIIINNPTTLRRQVIGNPAADQVQ